MSSLRKSFRMPWKTGKRYNILEGKENVYFNTPKYKDAFSDSDIRRRSLRPVERKLERNTNLSKSVREVVGSLKQKFRMSTRRLKRLNDVAKSPSPLRNKRGRRTPGKSPANTAHEVKIYSPFVIDTPSRTPSRIRTVSTQRRWRDDAETPTRLKKEVEALTANMQALATLTPATLKTRAITRRSTSPYVNGGIVPRPAMGTRSSTRLQAKRRIEMQA